MQKGSYHKFKLTMLNGSAWGLAVQDHQVSGEDCSAPKPEKNCILSRMFGRNTSNHCSKVFHEHEVGSLRKWTTCIPFSFYPYLFSTSQQPTVQFTAKMWTSGWGKKLTVPQRTTSSLVKQHNSVGFWGVTLINTSWRFASFHTRRITEPMLLDLVSKLLPTPIAGTS